MPNQRLAEKKDLCFVIMPKNKDADVIYELGVEKAAFQFNMECVREKLDGLGAGDRIADVVSNISKATVVVADLSCGRNEIVYELGMAHGLLKPVIMLVKSEEVVSFLPGTYKFIKYPEEIHDYISFAKVVKETIAREMADLERLRKSSNPVFHNLDPDRRPVDAAEHELVRDRLRCAEEAVRNLPDTQRLLEKAEEDRRTIKRLELENSELQGLKKFSETFFTRLFGEQVKNMTFDEIVRMFDKKLDEGDGEMVVQNSQGKRKKLKFRKLEGDERINL